jgi:hypothetical protein
LALVLGLTWLLPSCGGGSGQKAPDDAGSGSGGHPTDGGSGGAAGGDSKPITERPSRGTYNCRLARDRTNHAPANWRSWPALVTTSGGAAYFFRFDSWMSVVADPGHPDGLRVGSLSIEGVMGASTDIPFGGRDTVGSAAAAPRGDGFAVVWIDAGKLRFAAFDAAGAAIIAPRDVAAGVDAAPAPRLAAGPEGGFGVVYTSTAANSMSRQVFLLLLDDSGVARGAARRLDQTGAGSLGFPPLPAPAIVGGPSGYAMIWRNLSEAAGGIDFSRASADGTETIAPHRISVPVANTQVAGSAGFESPVNALLETSGGYLAAWVEVQAAPPTNLTGGASATVMVARLDSAGVRQGPPVPLRATSDSIDEVEPSLVRYGDAVAVLWARGTHIYICGGCVPDHRIDMLLIDPADLTPLSNVVSVTNGGTPGAPGLPKGGLLRRQVAVLGTSVLTTFDLTFHVNHTSGSATFACDAH